MSGHSKWSTIKRQKGAADAKRGQMFTKLAKAISIAVRQGGGIGDPASNFKLRLAVDRARASNMPKDNIERAISRAQGAGDGEALEETIYEGFGPGGIALIVEAVTDNKNRTTSEIKSIIEKNGGTLATPGAVSYQFSQKGQITIKKDNRSFDDIFMVAAEAGAEDVEDTTGEVIIYTKPEDLSRVKDALQMKGLEVAEAELVRKALTTILIEDKTMAKKILDFMEKIEAHDDVQKVFTNFEISDMTIPEIQGS